MVRNRSSSARTGFTLVELLVVIGVIALMMALVMPAFRGFGRSASMNSSVAQIRTAMSLSRQWAITQNRPVQIQFATSNTVSGLSGEAWRAFRSFAVFVRTNTTPLQGFYLKEWTALPPGVVITPDTSFFPGSGHGDNVVAAGRVATTRFPFVNSANLVQVRAIEFLPSGAIGSGNAEVYLAEGFVETNGVLSVRTNGMRFGVEGQILTGQVRVRDYNP